MDEAKKVLKWIIVGLAAAIVLLMFMPIAKTSSEYSEYIGSRERMYFYDILIGSGLLYSMSGPIFNGYYFLAGLIFGTLLLFTQFKNKDILSSVFLAFAGIYLFIFMRTIFDDDMAGYLFKKQFGYYLLLILPILQIGVSIAHAAVCIYENAYYE